MSVDTDQARDHNAVLRPSGHAIPAVCGVVKRTVLSGGQERLEAPASRIVGVTPEYEEFINQVQRHSEVFTPSVAEVVTYATLKTLGERLRADAEENTETLGESPARWLPEPLRGALWSSIGVEGECAGEFSLEELYIRVAEKSGISVTEAESYARAVAITLENFAQGPEVERIRSRLPDEFEFLFV